VSDVKDSTLCLLSFERDESLLQVRRSLSMSKSKETFLSFESLSESSFRSVSAVSFDDPSPSSETCFLVFLLIVLKMFRRLPITYSSQLSTLLCEERQASPSTKIARVLISSFATAIL
jgi:SUMO ligase MMS21 Smc5/6 complex component